MEKVVRLHYVRPMKRKLKVYAWLGLRTDNSIIQTREIVAAPNLAAAKKAKGLSTQSLCLGETMNDQEREQALSDPGQCFWKPAFAPDDQWRKSHIE